MRRLALLVVVVLGLLGGVAALDWWVDPYGLVYKPAALREAIRDNCLVSEELIGDAYFPFKEDVFRVRPTTTFVVGSSRVLKIAARPGERTFSNLGMPGAAPENLLPLFRDLAPSGGRPTVYLGVEPFWFNDRFPAHATRLGVRDEASYLTGWPVAKATVTILRSAPYALLHRWRREPVGRRCVVGRASPAIAWNLDGSRTWSWELDPVRYPPFTRPPFTRDLTTLRNGYYAEWSSFSQRRVRLLDRALAVAQRHGWRVVGFTPPDPPRYARFFATDPRVAPRWREFERSVPVLFRRRGFRWLDLRDARTVPCTAAEFPDAFHTDAACSRRIRARLDRAARAAR